jgi:cob(I)alamin adenosyltransferase
MLTDDTARQAARKAKVKKGLLIVNTGDGKGKTTSAMGTMLRAWGQGLRICVVQFIKAETGAWGEVKAAKKLGIEWHTLGDGFTWQSRDMSETRARALEAWQLAQGKITGGQYDLILLDEFTYVLSLGWLDVSDVIAWLKANKPRMLHLIITGRNAPAPLVDAADLVTEMREVKHPFRANIRAQKGIEF